MIRAGHTAAVAARKPQTVSAIPNYGASFAAFTPKMK
tara:strand:+ start:340 stop:450 length:111 start_codon:yes stop_codon:yes gene_type:complete